MAVCVVPSLGGRIALAKHLLGKLFGQDRYLFRGHCQDSEEGLNYNWMFEECNFEEETWETNELILDSDTSRSKVAPRHFLFPSWLVSTKY